MKHYRFLHLWLIFLLLPCVTQATEHLAFEDLYKSEGIYGLSFTQKVKDLAGKRVRVEGFMAPPLKAEANFFVLTQKPMAICPFCSSDADWPADIVVIYLEKKQTFVQYNAMILAEGILEYGSWTDPDTGFVSLLRLKEATFKKR
ncbi:MAG: hypothetical protein FWG26_03070 [Betaproteobacteria bacterium]|jgi:hypothetical protein|nr:hypothetical protein [Betaproteobacteria bacterium]